MRAMISLAGRDLFFSACVIGVRISCTTLAEFACPRCTPNGGMEGMVVGHPPEYSVQKSALGIPWVPSLA